MSSMWNVFVCTSLLAHANIVFNPSKISDIIKKAIDFFVRIYSSLVSGFDVVSHVKDGCHFPLKFNVGFTTWVNFKLLNFSGDEREDRSIPKL